MTAADDALNRLEQGYGTDGDLASVRAHVEAQEQELQRLRDDNQRNATKLANALGREKAAEAEVRRLTEGLLDIEEHARLGVFRAKSVPTDRKWPVAATIDRFTSIQRKARALLATSPPDGDGAK